MRISLSEIMNLPAGVQMRTVPLEMDSFTHAGVTYPITEAEPVTLTLTSLGSKKVRISMESRVVLAVLCGNRSRF